MALLLKKQFEIMYALREFSIREAAQLCDISKSTAQNYKKHGPPFYLRLKTPLGIDHYPASVYEENDFLKKAFQVVVQQRNTATKQVTELTASNNQKESENAGHKRDIEYLRKQVSNQGQTNQELTSKINQLENDYKTLAVEDQKKGNKIKEMETALERYKVRQSQDQVSINNFQKKISQVTAEKAQLSLNLWRLELKQKRIPRNYIIIGGVCVGIGTAVGIVIDRLFLNPPPSNPPLPSYDSINTRMHYIQ